MKQTNRTRLAVALAGGLTSMPLMALQAKSELLGCIALLVWGAVAVAWLFKGSDKP